jgi:hypothetical protein
MANRFSPFRQFAISLFVLVAGMRVYRQKILADNQLVNSQKDPDFSAFWAVLSQFLSQKCNEFSPKQLFPHQVS